MLKLGYVRKDSVKNNKENMLNIRNKKKLRQSGQNTTNDADYSAETKSMWVEAECKLHKWQVRNPINTKDLHNNILKWGRLKI